ncbi:DUF2590 family protein [Vibrio diabolicus]|uniref:DUF2590 domain-containing protein n=1 Tax=Vibrio rotiferianus TaxID=190895 RepID=A0A510IDP1_9VIBR|nr:DUF2590 family protein [Vibrio rotiferianus]MCS0326236.1 DUF2590 family protein [Vibrio diabolicus]TMX64559.1 DUF2590 domain-containing protein [Vibrio rotiferianus]CAH1557299.1 conserved hypothetical protein [Vibrio rotiferianus]CAH1558968.1 conserved hypothetical protein [Vibrio rotiferianus]BBL91829.1 hypothetical protein VroAM7_44820 [Vibrio rotiferianus]
MSDKQFIDIKVIDGGWELDAGKQPTQCSDLYSIAQDIKHAIMESGLARTLAAERNAILRADVLLQIEQKAEQDSRVVPGTATAVEQSPGVVFLVAQAYGFSENLQTEISE